MFAVFARFRQKKINENIHVIQLVYQIDCLSIPVFLVVLKLDFQIFN